MVNILHTYASFDLAERLFDDLVVVLHVASDHSSQSLFLDVSLGPSDGALDGVIVWATK